MDFLLDKLTTPAAFLFVLGVTIFVHELGHFITAKAFGMRVFVFSFGFGQRLLGFKWGDTDLRVSLIPLGGYVKLEGEPDDKIGENVSARGDGRDFTARPRWQRIIVYLAGPFMNGVLTVAILTGIFMHGAVLADYSDPPIVGAVEPGSPAASAGLQRGDEIVSIEGDRVKTWEDALMAILLRPDRSLDVRVHRGGQELAFKVQSRANERKAGEIGVHPPIMVGELTAGAPAETAGIRVGDVLLRIDGKPIYTFEQVPPLVQGADGRPLRIEVQRGSQPLAFEVTPHNGKIGLGSRRVAYRKYGFVQATSEAVKHTAQIAQQTVGLLQQLIRARISPGVALSGPLGIMTESGKRAREGTGSLLMLIAMISISVGILNLFPLPPLDGGHLAILVIESVIRRDLGPNAKVWIMNAGAIVLLTVIVLVVYLDFTKMDWFQRVFGGR